MPAILLAFDAKGLVAVLDADVTDVVRIEVKKRRAGLNGSFDGKSPPFGNSDEHRQANGQEQK
jgi:hypothetical protein